MTPRPSNKPTPRPSRNPTAKPTDPPLAALPPSSTGIILKPPHQLIGTVGSILVGAQSGITNDVLLQVDMKTYEESPTQLYQYGGFIDALGVVSKGDTGNSYFYLGPNINVEEGAKYGLVNVAIFLAQASIESVQYGLCDDINWEKDLFGKYPLANSCGQGRFAGLSKVPYQDSNKCAYDEVDMACPVVLQMRAVAETHGIFAGAPPPLECHPRSTTEAFAGAWDPSASCGEYGCTMYEGQTKGNIDDSKQSSNSVSDMIVQILSIH